MPRTVCTDPLGHVTSGVAMLSHLADEAGDGLDTYPAGNAEDELRRLLPGLLAQLPSDALDLLRHQLVHLAAVVAFTHRMRALAESLPEA
jgi:hypothetical protein